MKKPSNKYILVVDYPVCDLLVRDAQVDRASVRGQAGQELGRPQFTFLVDPFTRLIIPCELSYEEKEEANSEQ